MGQGHFAVILPAAGKSSRFGDPKQKKIYSELDGRAVWLRAVEPFVNRDDVSQIIMAIAPEDREMFDRRYRASVAFMNIKVIDGGRRAHRHRRPARSSVSTRNATISPFMTPPALASPTTSSTPSSPPANLMAPPCSPCGSPRPSSKSITITSPLAPYPASTCTSPRLPRFFAEISF